MFSAFSVANNRSEDAPAVYERYRGSIKLHKPKKPGCFNNPTVPDITFIEVIESREGSLRTSGLSLFKDPLFLPEVTFVKRKVISSNMLTSSLNVFFTGDVTLFAGVPGSES
mmetsp:Transcript_40601/g.53470  ORF Transcript_40601/g.53470 Transcript_40601/m.53470 type:complete len:112 (-) Transcript_40601:814-1149(-)